MKELLQFLLTLVLAGCGTYEKAADALNATSTDTSTATATATQAIPLSLPTPAPAAVKVKVTTVDTVTTEVDTSDNGVHADTLPNADDGVTTSKVVGQLPVQGANSMSKAGALLASGPTGGMDWASYMALAPKGYHPATRAEVMAWLEPGNRANNTVSWTADSEGSDQAWTIDCASGQTVLATLGEKFNTVIYFQDAQ